MKNVLITGVRRGLGKEIKEYLLKKKFFVYGSSRTLSKKEEEGSKTLFLDYTNKRSINAFSQYFIKNNIKLDTIIHNAGIVYLDPIETLLPEEIAKIFDVNFFGPVLLTKKLLPLLKAQKNGKLIFISSIVSVTPWPSIGMYAASKTALDACAFELAIMLDKWNIKVSVIHPNPLPTNMLIRKSKNKIDLGYPELKNRELKFEKVKDVCDIIHEIIKLKEPQFCYQTGVYSEKTYNNIIKKNNLFKSLKKYQEQLRSNS
jgi:NAD(P)-dependent dehydrogenase (short-subunit alcohol dehydrogenase family)